MRDRIKQIRKAANMTQAEFSVALGLSPTSAAGWEKKDAQIPTEPMRLLICKTFGINKSWLETGEGEMMADPIKATLNRLAETHVLTAQDIDLIQSFLLLNDKEKAMFCDIAKAIKK